MIAKEILSAEIFDWWEAERLKACEGCADMAEQLRTLAKAECSDLDTNDLLAKTSEKRAAIEAKIDNKVARFAQQMAGDLTQDWQASLAETEGLEQGGTEQNLDKAVSGGLALGSAGLLAAIPFAIPLAPTGITGVLVGLGFASVSPFVWAPAAVLGIGALTVGAFGRFVPAVTERISGSAHKRYLDALQAHVDKLLIGHEAGSFQLYFLNKIDAARDTRLAALNDRD